MPRPLGLNSAATLKRRCHQNEVGMRPQHGGQLLASDDTAV
ncbi:hypothetical protein [Halomonas salinarum]|nr:hypothetical protein [Halomonas salinarum]